MPLRRGHLDYETFCELNLKVVGVDLYTAHPSCKILWASYAIGNGAVKRWDALADPRPPQDLIDMLLDDDIEKWAFNAAFERLVTWRKLFPILERMGYVCKRKYRVWKCAMVLAYMQSFVGGLEQIGRLVGLPEHMQKDPQGTKLMNIFSMPNKPTKKQPLIYRDNLTDPWEWEEFGDYCVQDTVAEREIVCRLIKYPILDEEWSYYHLDQLINDRGLPIDRQFCMNGIVMSARRKAELTEVLRDLTQLPNPNSPVQLTAWLRERGYPFNDIGKDTVKKVLAENEAAPDTQVWSHEWKCFMPGERFITEDCEKALKLRQQVARTSVKKFDAIMVRLAEDDMIRHVFQFAGAQRTNRAAGRAMQPHNLSRTPKFLEPEDAYERRLEDVTEIIRDGDYEMLELYCKEPMNALAGTVRSSIQAPDGYELQVCDLSSIETVVIGGVTDCQRILNVFRQGLDAYKDFATELYGVPYADVTKKQRTDSKPATLGAGFGLGGGDLVEGKRTGLWGYAESMGIDITRELAHKAITRYREAYPEVQQTGYAFEEAIARTVRTGQRGKVGVIEFDLMKPYLRVRLPSGRFMYYHKPQVHVEERISKRGNPYRKEVVSYMGKQQNGQAWIRIYAHGGKWIENFVQAIARDILYRGMWLAHKAGFNLVGHVHDELICLERKGTNEFTWERLRGIMAAPIPWFPDLPLNAAGYAASFYRKD